MIPGIGTLINGFGVIISGILARIIFKKELKNFEENLLPLGPVSYTHLTLPTKA